MAQSTRDEHKEERQTTKTLDHRVDALEKKMERITYLIGEDPPEPAPAPAE